MPLTYLPAEMLLTTRETAPEDPAAVTCCVTIKQHIRKDSWYPMNNLTTRLWTQGQPHTQQANMQVAMFLCEVDLQSC